MNSSARSTARDSDRIGCARRGRSSISPSPELERLEAWTQACQADLYPDLARGPNASVISGARMNCALWIGKDAARGIGRVFPFSRLKEHDTGYTRSRNLPIQGACADAAMIALTLCRRSPAFNAGN